MKNNTKIRLHLSKQLFESLAKQIVAENKDMSGGAYTEAVKGPKMKHDKAAKMHKAEEKPMKEMETKVAEKKDGKSLEELKAAHKALSEKIEEMESSKVGKKDVSELVTGAGTSGAKQAAEQLMSAVSSGDPFWTGVALVGAVATGLIAGPKVVDTVKGYYKALFQKDPAKAEKLKDAAEEAGMEIAK